MPRTQWFLWITSCLRAQASWTVLSLSGSAFSAHPATPHVHRGGIRLRDVEGGPQSPSPNIKLSWGRAKMQEVWGWSMPQGVPAVPMEKAHSSVNQVNTCGWLSIRSPTVGEESVSRNMEGGSMEKVGLQLGFWRGKRRWRGGDRVSQTSEVRMAVVNPEDKEEGQVMGRRQG